MKQLAQLVELCIVVAAIGACVVVAAATVYDTLSALRRRRVTRALYGLRHHRLPHVTYLLHITSTADQLETCLDRMQHNYHAYDCVIVVEPTATLAAKQRARQVVAGRPRCRLYVRRKPASRAATLAAAYHRSRRGEYIVYSTPDELLDSVALRHALAWCRVAPRYGGVRFATIERRSVGVASLAAIWLQASHQLWERALPLRWSLTLSPGLYQQAAFRRYCRGQRISTQYRAEVIVESKRQPGWHMLVIITGVLLWMVALYSCSVAAVLISAWPLLTSWGIMCSWLIAAIWFSQRRTLLEKIDLTVCVPFGYFALFGSGILAVARQCIRRPTF